MLGFVHAGKVRLGFQDFDPRFVNSYVDTDDNYTQGR